MSFITSFKNKRAISKAFNKWWAANPMLDKYRYCPFDGTRFSWTTLTIGDTYDPATGLLIKDPTFSVYEEWRFGSCRCRKTYDAERKILRIKEHYCNQVFERTE